MERKNKRSVADKLTWFNIKIPSSLHDKLVELLQKGYLSPSYEFCKRVEKWLEEEETQKKPQD